MLKIRNSTIPSFDGQPLFVTEWEVHPKPTLTLFLVGGVGSGSTAWDFIIELLPKDLPVRCVSFDLRGHGLSSHHFPPGFSSPQEACARDLAAVIEYAGAKNILLVGHSFGGMTIQEYLHQTQQYTTPFLLISSTSAVPNYSLFPKAWYQLLGWYSRNKRRHSLAPNRNFHLRWKNSFDFSLGRIIGDIRFIGPLTFLLFWLSNVGWSMKDPELAQSQHAYALAGEHDLVIGKKLVEELGRTYPHLHLTVISTNHNAIVNAPEACANRMAEIAAHYAQKEIQPLTSNPAVHAVTDSQPTATPALS